jgi:hypothetical protein
VCEVDFVRWNSSLRQKIVLSDLLDHMVSCWVCSTVLHHCSHSFNVLWCEDGMCGANRVVQYTNTNTVFQRL